jgi:NADH-quinone oxidoreductase subunit N
VIYFDAPAPAFDRRPTALSFVGAVTGLFTLLFFVFPGPLVAAAGTAAAVLFG